MVFIYWIFVLQENQNTLFGGPRTTKKADRGKKHFCHHYHLSIHFPLQFDSMSPDQVSRFREQCVVITVVTNMFPQKISSIREQCVVITIVNNR